MKNTILLNHVIYENFTNTISESKLILRSGEEILAEKIKNLDFDNFLNFIEEYLINDLPASPYIVYTGCGSIKYFESKMYSPETVDLLNKKGLEIFLYEELLLSTGPKLPYYLHVTTPNDPKFFEDYGNYIRGFESSDNNLEQMYSFELESIKTLIENNGLKNVTVNCCEFNVDRYLQKLYPMMTIQNKNIYIKFLANTVKRNNFSRRSDFITKKFLSMNNKYKGHRHLTAAYLFDKESNISFDHTKAIYGGLKNHLWFDINSWKTTNSDYFKILSKNLLILKNNNPVILDTSSEIPNPNFNTEFDYAPAKFFNQCFCSIITETFYSKPITALTEKTINAIANFHPFILVAPPYTLEHLKFYGFKTFSEHWSEEYDQEENHEHRLIKIFQVIDDINNKSIEELRDLYNKIFPIIEHNYKNLDKLAQL